MWTQLTNRTECVNVSYVNSFMAIWSRASSEDKCKGISFYGSVEPRVCVVHAIYIHVIFTNNADWSAVLFDKRTCRREGKFSSLFCNTIYRQMLHILMKNSENRIWVMYNIKVHYVKVTEPCSVYLPRKIEICRSYMRSNRLYSETAFINRNANYFWSIKTLPRSSKSCDSVTFRVLKYLLSTSLFV